MTETQASPEADGSSQLKLAADKDRQCPFCNTKFTSSSLGRHLDLYIREKNPKAPDGIHNVNEIRKLRGNVTRRHARNSFNKRESSTPASSKSTSLRDRRSPSTPGVPPGRVQRSKGLVNFSINQANWTTTGVINGLTPEIENASPTSNHGRTAPRKVSIKEEIHRKEVALDERDRARAAECALREVLSSVKAAKYSLHDRNPQSPNTSDN